MNGKKIGIVMGAVSVILAASMIESTETQANMCKVEGCTQIEEHTHNNCGIEGCTQIEEHTHTQQGKHHSGHSGRTHH